MDERPLVSVLINNYNLGRYVRDAIESVLAQTYDNFEVIVVDDGSTDDSRDLLAAYGGHERIKLVFTRNGGQAAAFNHGFEHSKGDIVCFLDADDVFIRTKLDRVVGCLNEHPEAAWLRHNMDLTDEGLVSIGTRLPDYHESGVRHGGRDTCLEDPLRFVVTSAIVMRRDLAEKVLPIAREHLPNLRICADAYLGVRAVQEGACYTLACSLAKYRRQPQQRIESISSLISMIERNMRIEMLLFDIVYRRRRTTPYGTDVYKYRLALSSMAGVSLLGPARISDLFRGLQSALRVALIAPALSIRNTAALVYAFLMPKHWLSQVYTKLGGESSSGH